MDHLPASSPAPAETFSTPFTPALPTRHRVRLKYAHCLDCDHPLGEATTECCPACDRVFSSVHPASYAWRPPYIPWRYWSPPCVLTGLLVLTLLPVYGLTLLPVVPALLIGSLTGYQLRSRSVFFLLMGMFGLLLFPHLFYLVVDRRHVAPFLDPHAAVLARAFSQLPLALALGLVAGSGVRIAMFYRAHWFSQKAWLHDAW